MFCLCRRLSVALLWLLAVGAVDAANFANPNFTETAISRPDGGGWQGLVAIQFSPDGSRIYALEREGKIWVIDQNQPLATPLLDISDEVFTLRDHGMLGFALDPDFAANGYLYLYYVVDRHHLEHCQEPTSGSGAAICDAQYDVDFSTNQTSATIGRITRYQLQLAPGQTDYHRAEATNYDSRLVLLGRDMTDGAPVLHDSHGVGSLLFGTDGSLLASMGDGASFSSVDVGSASETAYQRGLADGIIRFDENVGAYRAQMINSLSGKVLRLNPQTGEGYPSNPFYHASYPRSPQSRVWALGLRNPFRMTIKPGTGSHNSADGNPGVLLLGDVGYFDWEELLVIDRPALNFGWPVYEGMDFEHRYYARSPVDTLTSAQLGCEVLFRELIAQQQFGSWSLTNPCGGLPLSGLPAFEHRRPTLTWFDGELGAFTPHFQDGSAISVKIGDAIPGTATVPVSGTPFRGNSSTGGIWYQTGNYPESYFDSYFHGDFGAQWIRHLRFDEQYRVTEVNEFADDAGGVVFIGSHPQSGDLYYISWASFLYHVEYAPGGNRPPQAQIAADKQFGASPLTVNFSSAQSSDPEQQALQSQWQFGDGSEANGTQVSHQFVADSSAPQQFEVSLTVTDSGNPSQSDRATMVVSVNNTPPQVSITSPLNNSLYPLVGDSIYPLTAAISDNEHSASQLSCQWQLSLVHNDHQHDDPPLTDCDAEVVVAPIGCDGDQYHYAVTLTVTDGAGLATSAVSRMYPDCSGDNGVPVARPDSYNLQLGQADIFLEVISNDDFAADMQLELLSQPSHGLLSAASDNLGFVYSSVGNQALTDRFSYRLVNSQGLRSAPAEVTINLANLGDWPQLADVQIWPNDGQPVEYGSTLSLQNPNPSALIRFSGDGSEPTPASTDFRDPTFLFESQLIQARAYLDGYLPSNIASQYIEVRPQPMPLPTAGLIGYWPLNEGSGNRAVDYSGSGFDGVISGASWSSGWDGAALRFDGSNDLVRVDHRAALSFAADEDFSISVWVNPDADSGWRGLVTKSRDQRPWYGLWIDPDDDWVFGGNSNLATPQSIQANRWQHLVAVQHGALNRRDVYLDGVLVATGAGQPASGSGDLLFAGTDAVSEYFAGSLDEIRLYRRALSADEVATLATIAPGGEQPQLLVANDDSATVLVGEAVDIAVLANDSADAGLALDSVEIVTAPMVGNIELINSDSGTVVYRHLGDSATVDSFSYRVQDGNGQWSQPATVTITVQAVTSVPTLEQGLLGYWSFEGNDPGFVQDFSGNQRSGRIDGAQRIGGRFGQGLQFDGVDDQVVVAHDSGLAFARRDSYTLSVWVEASLSQSGWRGLVNKSRDDSPWYGLWISARDRWTYGGGNLEAVAISSGWHHLLITQDGEAGSRRFYIDGELVRRGDARTSDGSGDLLFGAAASVAEFFQGKLDEVRLYDRAFSDDEASALYQYDPNSAPVEAVVAADDSASVAYLGLIDIAVFDNDSADSGIDPFSFELIEAPQSGEVYFDVDSGLARYVHQHAAPSDSFRYRFSSENGQQSNVATVTVAIAQGPPTISVSAPQTTLSTEQSLLINWQLGGDQSLFNHLHISVNDGPHITLHQYDAGQYSLPPQTVGSYQVRVWLVDQNHQAIGGDGSEDSITFTVVPLPQTPSILPAGGSFAEPVTVTLQSADPVPLYYSLDGSLPTTTSQRYQGAFDLTESTTLKAVAINSDGVVSAVAEADFVITSSEPQEPDLVGYWPLDNIAAGSIVEDRSGNGLDGVNIDGVVVQGQVNGALYFDGNQARVEIPHDPALAFEFFDSFTLSVWVKLDGEADGWTAIVNKSRNERPFYGLWIAPWNRWKFGGAGRDSDGPRVADDGQWHHLVIKQSMGLRSLYVDGESKIIGMAADGDGSGPMWFAGAPSVSEAFKGYLDEVRLYRRALSDEEIQALGQP
ncbi:LamG-like jellyroll fold domain-containing protein [Ferrimonas senticii]|uniref:LamG-like jellyroll fold domain-containing protein n=1 Tax=Ferrimonas senticii TaxID=394566 RepID=UPI0004205145|nr:LamG-like jellyroll fold domain-containing protein [Ferrimonas senticii]